MAEPKRLREIADESEDQGCQPKLNSPVKTTSGGERLPANFCENPVKILPPEVLELIFKNVESPNDLLNCWNTTSAWRSALRSTEFYFKMTLPFMLPYLTSRDLLQCSSVSKSWNAAIDICLQEKAEDFENDHKEPQIVLKLNSRNMTEFIQRFALSTSDGSGGKLSTANPVVFRNVHVKLDIQLCLKRFQRLGRNHYPLSVNPDVRNLLKCLEHHGHLIRNLKLDIDSFISSFTDKLKLLKSCLKLTPNLQALHIMAINVITGEEDESSEEPEIDHSKYPWPGLGHLKSLVFGPFTDRIELAEIANANAPQLVDFDFGFKLEEPHRPLSNRFSCVQKIEYNFAGSCSGNGMEFGAFVKSSRCPLKHLTIRFDEPDKADLENFDGLAIAANAASETLKALILVSYPSRLKGLNVDVKKFDKLRLPQLNLLFLSGFGYPSLDFLQSACPALEVLLVKPSFSDSGRLEMGENGEIYGDLYSEHQFWNNLADLQVVVVDCMFESKYVLVDGKRKGRKIKQKIPGGKAEKVYTRPEYRKLERDRRIAIINQASTSEEKEKETGYSRAKCQQNENIDAPDVLMTRSKNVYKRN